MSGLHRTEADAAGAEPDLDAAPAPDAADDDARLAFVVQEYHASHLHWDFRLELEGTLKSWAVPKGPDPDPAVKRLAVQVEDHPLAYRHFEGRIPRGQYGAGTVSIWDHGHWQPLGDARAALARGTLHFELFGQRLHGRWTLARTRRSKQWLLFHDGPDIAPAPAPAAVRAALPATLAPMLGIAATRLPEDALHWSYEARFDGQRLLMRRQGTRLQLFARNGLDWSARLSTLAHRLAAAALPDGWYDGELVALGADGRPDAGALQAALDRHGGGRDAVFAYHLFDLPFCDGRDLRLLPLQARRATLQALIAGLGPDAAGGVLRFSADFDVAPAQVQAHASRLGLEGIMAKRRDAPYVSTRSGDWLKVKCHQRQAFVIGGTSAPGDADAGIGALLLGVRDTPNGPLRYVGNVGGIEQAMQRTLHEQLPALHAAASPFGAGPAPEGRALQWLRPELVADLVHNGFTRAGLVRQGVLMDVREDKPATPAPRRTTALARITPTHPERVIDARSGLTKLDLVRYYADAARLIAPHLAARPAAFVRAPDGVAQHGFFQKHGGPRSKGIAEVMIDAEHALFEVSVPEGLLAAVQWNVVEFHTAGETVARPRQPDRLVLDLDPGDGLAWAELAQAALRVRVLVAELGLVPFVKTSGGSGLHIVAPLRQGSEWPQCKAFAKALADHLAATVPQTFVAVPGPRHRVGKVFVDYLRNQPGATTVAAWSTRARPGLGVSVPLDWSEIDPAAAMPRWSAADVLGARPQGNAPWAAYARSRRALAPAHRKLAAAERRR